MFTEVLEMDFQKNKYYNEYKRKLDQEMQKFNGRVLGTEGSETASQYTSASKGTRKSAASIMKGTPTNSPDRGNEHGDDHDAPFGGTLNDRAKSDDDSHGHDDDHGENANEDVDEDALEQERYLEEQRKKDNNNTQY